jgi:hypothetical protein
MLTNPSTLRKCLVGIIPIGWFVGWTIMVVGPVVLVMAQSNTTTTGNTTTSNSSNTCIVDTDTMQDNRELLNTRPPMNCSMGAFESSCTVDGAPLSTAFQNVCEKDVGGKFHYQNWSSVCTKSGQTKTYHFVNYPECFSIACSMEDIDKYFDVVHYPYFAKKHSTDGDTCEVKDKTASMALMGPHPTNMVLIVTTMILFGVTAFLLV